VGSPFGSNDRPEPERIGRRNEFGLDLEVFDPVAGLLEFDRFETFNARFATDVGDGQWCAENSIATA
jgi:hypothetical protein